MIETRRTCVISMAHLKTETVEHLRDIPLASWPVMGAPLGPDMIVIYAHTETDLEMEVFPDLCAVIEWARAQIVEGANPPHDPGFEYVILDRDVEPDEDGTNLPDYLTPEKPTGRLAEGYLDRFPEEHRESANTAYEDGFEDGATEAGRAEEQRDALDRILRDLIGEMRNVAHPSITAALVAAERMRAEVMKEG